MTTAATVARIGRSHPRPGTTAANDEDNRPTGSTAALAFCLVASPFVLVGLVKLVLFIKGLL